jgi:hypothetical protein
MANDQCAFADVHLSLDDRQQSVLVAEQVVAPADKAIELTHGRW